MVTLTDINDGSGRRVAAAKRLSRAFKLIMKRAKRAWPKHHFDYAAIFEQTKKHWPHLHIVTRELPETFDEEWLRDQLRSITGAVQVRITTRDDPEKCAGYLAGYLNEAPVKFGNLKRYWTTPGWDLSKKPRPLIRWTFSRENIEHWAWVFRQTYGHCLQLPNGMIAGGFGHEGEIIQAIFDGIAADFTTADDSAFAAAAAFRADSDQHRARQGVERRNL